MEAATIPAACVYKLAGLCFILPAEQSGGFFGFAEFVQAFGLLALMFTLSDVQYHFRLDTSPVPFRRIAIWLSGFIGMGTLLTDFWFLQRYPIPSFLATRLVWQLFFGSVFLFLGLTWLLYGFARPPIFGKLNAFYFTRTLYRYLLQGKESDLPTVAAELGRSASSIIKHAAEYPYRNRRRSDEAPLVTMTTAQYANDLMLLIGMRKFCRHIVAAAPGTAIAFFKQCPNKKNIGFL